MLNSNARPNNAHRNSELDSRNNYTTSEESKISTTLFGIYIPRQLSEFHMHAVLKASHIPQTYIPQTLCEKVCFEKVCLRWFRSVL